MHVVCNYIEGVFVVVHDSVPPSDVGIPDGNRARLLAEVARLRAELSPPVVRLRGA